MKSTPKLLNNNDTVLLKRELFSDLQLDRVISEQTISVLQKPCTRNEIRRRNEVFELLEDGEYLEQMQNVLAVLSAAERSFYLLRDEKNSLDRYYRYREVLEGYIGSCESLASMSALGGIFADVSNYFSSEQMLSILADMKEASKRIKSLLRRLHIGLLSFSDKSWLTPDYDSVSEYDRIAQCAKALGFTVSDRKKQNIKIDFLLSDAICRLYADEISEIEAEISKFADVDLCEPFAYIPEIKFFLEINSLIKRANDTCVPHCYPRIAQVPRYVAKELYDISLLAKNCKTIVPNDSDFTENEPFCFLVGANGGGKTTYIRALGVNLVLFLSGCPVFASDAEIYPFDIVCAHFPMDERFDNIGRLDEEVNRTEVMLKTAQNKTAFLLFNETFSGTDDKRGVALLKNCAEQIRENKHFGLYVTHFYDVMSLDYPVLSAEVDFDDENKRTFRIVRSKGSASSYAMDILKKYRIDRDSLSVRRNEYGN